MNWMEIIEQFFEVCFFPLLGALTTVLVFRIKSKWATDEKNIQSEITQRYLILLNEIIVSCVKATNQTYVNIRKEQGAFDDMAKKIALQKTKEAVMLALGEEAKKYLKLAVGDIEAYIIEKIESSIEDVKVK